jgi:hypothetical protein
MILGKNKKNLGNEKKTKQQQKKNKKKTYREWKKNMKTREKNHHNVLKEKNYKAKFLTISILKKEIR